MTETMSNSNNHDQIDSIKEVPPKKDAAATRKTSITDEKEKKIKKKYRNKCDYGDDFVAPDGGWGWLVAIFYNELMMDLGLLNGPLYRRYSFRQVALMGSFLLALGHFLCIFADSFIFYIIAFSIFYGLGRGLILSASSLTVNIYFKQRRRTATAYQFGVAGLGPIVLPFLATFLMQFYGAHGAVLIFSGICLHTFACALIFQPVQWHVKKSDDKNHQESQQQVATEIGELKSDCPDMLNLKNAQDQDNTFDHGNQNLPESSQKFEPQLTQEEHKKRSFFQKIVTFFDLYLLLDVTFINFAFGLAVVFVVEVNFGVLTPFILADFGLTKNQIANTMSINAFCDLVTRFLIPVITAKMNFSNKTYFLCGVLGMTLGRAVLSVTRNYYIILGVYSWLGFSKAFRFVFWFLILPDYVPLKRLPAAWGLHYMMASIFSLAVGPQVGLIRDRTSYDFMLYFFNGLSLVIVLMWVLEDLWRKLQHKPKETNS